MADLAKPSIVLPPPEEVECPLCHDNANAREHKMELKYEPVRLFNVFLCSKYKVAIRQDDPFVGRWDEALEKAGKIDCPNCNAEMRYFATSTGFMKAVCPKKSCGATLHNGEPDRKAFEMPEATPDKPSTLQ